MLQICAIQHRFLQQSNLGKIICAATIKPGMKTPVAIGTSNTRNIQRCRKKFLFYFRNAFATPKYDDWERGYKWNAHVLWLELLNKKEFRRLLGAAEYAEIANRAVRIESKTNLLFSFEKMALRDATKTLEGATAFAEGLYQLVYGTGKLEARFTQWIAAVASLPRKQTRVLTWPLVTVFGFIANPGEFIFLKPRITKIAAEKYGFPFNYVSSPNWETYRHYLGFAEQVGTDLIDWQPKDMIDIQSFLWVLGSDEYPD
jgi:hypothetical protein